MPKKIFVIFALINSVVFSQNIDSLKLIIEKNSGLEQLDALFDLAYVYEDKDYDSSMFFFDELLKIANQTKNIEFIVKSQIGKGRIYKNKGDYQKATEFYNNALKNNNLIKNNELYSSIFNNFGILYKNQGNYSKAIEYYNKSILYYKKNNDNSSIAYSFTNIANIYNIQGNFDEALIFYNKAIKIAEKIKDNTILSSSYNGIGVIYYMTGNYNGAIKYFQKTLKIKEIIQDLRGESMCYNNIGMVHYEQHNYIKSIKYYEKALDIYVKLGDKQGIAGSYSNLGIVYNDMKKFEKAIQYFDKALKINTEVGNKFEMSNVLSNLASTYLHSNRIRKSKYYFEKALKLKEELDDKEGISSILISLSSVFEEIGDSTFNKYYYNISISYAKKGLIIANEIGTIPDQKIAYESLYKSYFKINDINNAYKYLTLYTSIKDSLYNSSKMQEIEMLEAKFDTEKKEQEIEKNKIVIQKQNAEAKQLEAEASKQKIMRNAFILGLILSIIVIILILVNLKNKRRANKLLTEQKNQIIEKNEELNQQNEEILAQRDEIEVQKEKIEKIHLNLTESIDYAKNIQSSVLPSQNLLKNNFSDYFLMFSPKDVVSGDFYWWTKLDDVIIIAVADCTGHGVPGAFMSMLGISLLSEIVDKEKNINPNIILNKLREGIIKALGQQGRELEQKDGMDISLVAINTKTYFVEYAGANNPLYFISKTAEMDSELIVIDKNLKNNSKLFYEIKPDKMPISIYLKMESFTNKSVQLSKGDKIFLFSDGYADQFGGYKGKKFKYAQLKQLLFDSSNLPMLEQKNIVESTFENWIGNYTQIDDVLILGITV